MSGYPQGNPQYPNIYPQIYNPSSAPPPAAMAYPAVGVQPYSAQPYAPTTHGFVYQAYPGQPSPAMPHAQPSAPQVFPNPYQDMTVHRNPSAEWVPTTPAAARSLSDRAVVAGYEGYDHSPLWVIRARHEGDLVPGKLAINHRAAYVAWNGREHSVNNIEVYCANSNLVQWVQSSNGNVPRGAIAAGHTAQGETLYVGRARYEGSLTPGKVHPSHKMMYMSFGGKEIPHQSYEVLCAV